MILTLVLLLNILHRNDCTYVISVYGDVYKDTKFFSKTYPWLIDNIGGEVVVDYYLLGSGRYTVPQMCALNELRLNTFLQAQFLKCEAEGNSNDICICDTGLDTERLRHCIITKGSLASFAASKFHQIGIDASPLVEIGPRNTIFEVEDNWYLKKICTIFGDNQPRGCIKPFSCNYTESEYDMTWSNHIDCTKCRHNSPITSTTTSLGTTYAYS
ncbi:PREDICTED: uncharacterized protein LOC106099593 [Papilio polytes]|uniref:uncharacterized protein LOC106099593 n=1 Tax=Papilio polytes TaxID=76194 RepID=UPI00067602C0|nr:PREDICTED: uncharacterized protein LOC106099593 [Papilio polytes]